MRHFDLVSRETRSDGWDLTVVVPASCPLFEGHFPGRPILPAIGQLQLIAEIVEAVGLDAGLLLGVRELRLQRPVVPGQRLQVSLSRTAPGRLVFRIHDGGTPVSRGTLAGPDEAR